MTKRWNLDRVMRFLRNMVLASVAIVLVYYLRGVLFPFFAAFLIAYIVDPLVNWLQKKVKHRIIAVIIVLLIAGLVIGGALRLFIPMVVNEIQNLGILIAKMFNDSEWSSRIAHLMPGGLFETIHSLISWDQLAVAMQRLDFWSEVQNIAGKVLPGAWGVLSYTGTIVLWFSGAAVIFMYLVFIMLDMPKLRRGLFSLLPDKYADGAVSFVKETDVFMGTYVWQIPGSGKDYPINPGESFVIAASGIDHSKTATTVDLSTAEFETICDKYKEKGGQPDANALNMTLRCTIKETGLGNQLGKFTDGAWVIFYPSQPLRKDGEYLESNHANNYGQEVLKSDVLDAIDLLKTENPDDKRLPIALDAGWIKCKTTGGNQSVVRKVAETLPDGRIVLQDTNNTTDDFTVNDTPQIRRYGVKRPAWSTWNTAQ